MSSFLVLRRSLLVRKRGQHVYAAVENPAFVDVRRGNDADNSDADDNLLNVDDDDLLLS